MAGFVTQSEYISLPICNDHRDTHLQPPTKHLSWGTVSVSLLCWQELNFWLVAVVQSLSHVRLFVISWTAACQLSLVFAFSQSLLKFMSIESVMPSNHLILCRPHFLLPSVESCKLCMIVISGMAFLPHSFYGNFCSSLNTPFSFCILKTSLTCQVELFFFYKLTTLLPLSLY